MNNESFKHMQAYPTFLSNSSSLFQELATIYRQTQIFIVTVYRCAQIYTEVKELSKPGEVTG